MLFSFIEKAFSNLRTIELRDLVDGFLVGEDENKATEQANPFLSIDEDLLSNDTFRLPNVKKQ